MGEVGGPDERHVREFEKFRAELLDLTRRNPMLNYKHSPRSRQHLRIVDTRLEFVLSELLQSRTPVIKALPDPDDVPEDEKAPKFVAALNHAKLTDLEYLTRLESLDGVARQEDAELAKLGRWLRDRVREQLGLPPSVGAHDVSTFEHARSLGINPNFALSDNSVNTTRLSHLQTLFFADELDARVGRIAADARLSEQEMGLSTLFLAFGFLRWFDGTVTGIPNFAPLLLLLMMSTSPSPISSSKHDSGSVYRPLSETLRKIRCQDGFRVSLCLANVAAGSCLRLRRHCELSTGPGLQLTSKSDCFRRAAGDSALPLAIGLL
jgi:hypothetical protein